MKKKIIFLVFFVIVFLSMPFVFDYIVHDANVQALENPQYSIFNKNGFYVEYNICFYDSIHRILADPERFIQKNQRFIKSAEWDEIIPNNPRCHYHYLWTQREGYKERKLLLIDDSLGAYVVRKEDVDSSGRWVYDTTVVVPASFTTR